MVSVREMDEAGTTNGTGRVIVSTPIAIQFAKDQLERCGLVFKPKHGFYYVVFYQSSGGPSLSVRNIQIHSFTHKKGSVVSGLFGR